MVDIPSKRKNAEASTTDTDDPTPKLPCLKDQSNAEITPESKIAKGGQDAPPLCVHVGKSQFVLNRVSAMDNSAVFRKISFEFQKQETKNDADDDYMSELFAVEEDSKSSVRVRKCSEDQKMVRDIKLLTPVASPSVYHEVFKRMGCLQRSIIEEDDDGEDIKKWIKEESQPILGPDHDCSMWPKTVSDAQYRHHKHLIKVGHQLGSHIVYTNEESVRTLRVFGMSLLRKHVLVKISTGFNPVRFDELVDLFRLSLNVINLDLLAEELWSCTYLWLGWMHNHLLDRFLDIVSKSRLIQLLSAYERRRAGQNQVGDLVFLRMSHGSDNKQKLGMRSITPHGKTCDFVISAIVMSTDQRTKTITCIVQDGSARSVKSCLARYWNDLSIHAKAKIIFHVDVAPDAPDSPRQSQEA